ncbi:hypothetical protein JCM6882_007876 [Rhodosporidiobolus microsporus]
MSKTDDTIAAVQDVAPPAGLERSLFFRFRHWLALSNPDWSVDHKAEQSLIRRLDIVPHVSQIFFISYVSLSAITKYLDQVAISNAYVSGMKEDLNLYGNELNYLTTYFNIGYILVIPISAYLMNGILRPSIWLPTSEILWGLFTGLIALAKDAKMVYGFRFVVGFFEGTAWPGTMILLLNWYTPGEVGLRIAIYQCATTLGGIFAGVFQAALYTNLDGVHGLRGYQWLFVVNACITGAVAIWGYFSLPDYPHQPNPWGRWWLKQRHLDAALARTHRLGRKLPSGWTRQNLFAVFRSWRIYAIWFSYEVVVQAGGGISYFNLWLKSLKIADGTARYSVAQINHIPIAGNVINIVTILTVMALSDRFQTQWPFLFFCAGVGLIFSALLAHWDISDNAKFASYLLLNITAPSTNLFVAWVGTLAQHSAEERSVIISCLVIGAYVFNAWAPILTWPAKEAPHYRIGWNYATAMYAIMFPSLALIVYLAKRQQRQQQREERVRDGEEGGTESEGGVEAVSVVANVGKGEGRRSASQDSVLDK